MSAINPVLPIQLPPRLPWTQRALSWSRSQLFPSPGHSLLTLGTIALLAWCIPTALNWLVFNATFVGTSGKDCNPAGACWLPITQRWNLFVYGFYPEAEQWRVSLSLILAGATFVLLFFKRLDRRLLLGYLAVLPVLMWWLLKGGVGLTPVSSTQFAGMLVTVFLGVVGMVFALPLGILLALGRRSKLPVIRLLSVLYIELVRSVPVISLLFMASLMIQLFLPPGSAFDILLRVQLVLILFTAAYMAETLRGGLQNLPRGQYEAAQALGFGYWKAMGQIILPQVLKQSIAPLLTQFIGLFKETTLVMIVGVLDIVGIAMSTAAAPEWVNYGHEIYVFLALYFFVICFALSRYARHLEQRMEQSRS
ncbi:amino acid ABC transporter permease [Pseudomonas agarici]|uniref:Amino acid ABC transporter permease n=1 Tax=Pseudomonas agarici TaxID=46677 RepID=A0A0X1T516_PSEAA|nr:amino acid ABC transporter permease [Pseudomonas agarici]AMB87214.1 amino acid ABC transporter permease [Pseudomonas agarici]NWB92655.1 amino acid ABC transporter permease [Pseudomonas agarici]NWC10614.1 amino acid ABC transporter permease [Pseudomonas agarici]SEL11247.1 amino acid ABC transporter membrane protein 2, PAAT family [Pseudomonas agarici]